MEIIEIQWKSFNFNSSKIKQKDEKSSKQASIIKTEDKRRLSHYVLIDSLSHELNLMEKIENMPLFMEKQLSISHTNSINFLLAIEGCFEGD